MRTLKQANEHFSQYGYNVVRAPQTGVYQVLFDGCVEYEFPKSYSVGRVILEMSECCWLETLGEPLRCAVEFVDSPNGSVEVWPTLTDDLIDSIDYDLAVLAAKPATVREALRASITASANRAAEQHQSQTPPQCPVRVVSLRIHSDTYRDDCIAIVPVDEPSCDEFGVETGHGYMTHTEWERDLDSMEF